MTAAVRIRSAFERNAKALRLRPSLGRGTAVTRVHASDELACEVEEGPWRMRVDLGTRSGGSDSGPNPGVLGRAALGSCLAISYLQWAAVRSVPIASLDVEVHADYDARGMFGVGDAAPGYSEIRCVVRIVSDAPEDVLERLLEEAEAHSSYIDVFRRPVPVKRELRVSAPRR